MSYEEWQKRIKNLKRHENRWETDMGAWFPGERVVFRGKDLFSDLVDSSWMDLFLFGITGRRFEERQIKLFEAIWVICTSYPDPRLWNNRVAALAGSVRSTAALAIGAASAVSGASIYGGRPAIRSIDFLYRTRRRLKAGEKLTAIVEDELKKYRGLPGYGRPIVKEDERIKYLLAKYRILGFMEGEFVRLVFDIQNILLAGRWRLKMNIASLVAALTAEQGMTTIQSYHYLTLCFTAGIFPCYLDAINKEEGLFFPISCSRINYTGPSNLSWENN